MRGVPNRSCPLPPNLVKKKKVKFTYGKHAERDWKRRQQGWIPLFPLYIWTSDEHVAVGSPQQAGAIPQQWQEVAWLVKNNALMNMQCSLSCFLLCSNERYFAMLKDMLGRYLSRRVLLPFTSLSCLWSHSSKYSTHGYNSYLASSKLSSYSCV